MGYPGSPRGPLGLVAFSGLAFVLLLAGIPAKADPPINDQTPLAFFTNIASRLLASELNVDLNHIELSPTNSYTRPVHRLLQLAANLCDARTNGSQVDSPDCPSVFRPLFGAEVDSAGTNWVFIKGYEEITNRAEVTSAEWRDLGVPEDVARLHERDMVYGVPLIIGAKKGFPNFNEFAMQTQVEVRRRLEFVRTRPTDRLPTETNQMYLVAVTNVFGVEAWNSYTNPFPRDLEMEVEVDLTFNLTNEVPGQIVFNPVSECFRTNLTISANCWTGLTDVLHAENSFRIPLNTGFSVVPDSAWSQIQRKLVPLPVAFEKLGSFPVPRLWLLMHSRLRFVLSEVGTGRIVDFVNLDSVERPVDITDALMTGGKCDNQFIPDAYDGSLWCTNRFGAKGDVSPTAGVLNQILASLGMLYPPYWAAFALEAPAGQDHDAAIDSFRAQFSLAGLVYPNGTFPRTNLFYAPLVPVRNLCISTSWQANDPLVHYTLEDLLNPDRTNRIAFTTNSSPVVNLGRLNTRYEPWGGSSSFQSASPTRYDLSVKDPLVRTSDDWEFPNKEGLSPKTIGRVHRGTPWQTIYLKSTAPNWSVWRRWVGGGTDALFLHPSYDRHVASLIVSLSNTNHPAGLSSVNQAASTWPSTLDGLRVLTNTLSDADFKSNPRLRPRFEELLVTSNSPQAETVATAISSTRAIQPGQIFRSPTDILSVPELSVKSPWLNRSSVIQLERGISDEAYEAIPSQLLSRLRPESLGYASVDKGSVQIQFTGIDGYPYSAEVSSNLVDWHAITTHYPSNGVFRVSEPITPDSSPMFYRSSLLK